MRNMIRGLFLATFSVGLLSACGPASEPEASPSTGEAAQVEQGIGKTPDCAFDESLAEQVIWSSTCAACREVGGDGSWPNGSYGRSGTLYMTCCGPNGCGSWQNIRPVCTSC
ncbi:hypothetical protein COCOR_05204 [Corallococcus coralloides DSM 2259]|uniref:Lipoprotein n=1 Tax=Corallococcus coralloides (strain ATCC 25202 / DSM 2259 / NBRC 100086 / M2) TaxID=1144275 RepID=H8MSV7_CORCM|nr:hypothetical protein [Corallococcus coralloides]AFE06248.1 hypothetical protein COCOR_05204 [Corallococcus coralloides DSM 2259]